MNHPHITSPINAPGKHRNNSRMPAASFKVPINSDTEALQRRNAEDGSRRLAVAICQYHVKYAKTQERSFWWSRRGKEISFGNKG